jgi:hypothetical protein
MNTDRDLFGLRMLFLVEHLCFYLLYLCGLIVIPRKLLRGKTFSQSLHLWSWDATLPTTQTVPLKLWVGSGVTHSPGFGLLCKNFFLSFSQIIGSSILPVLRMGVTGTGVHRCRGRGIIQRFSPGTGIRATILQHHCILHHSVGPIEGAPMEGGGGCVRIA